MARSLAKEQPRSKEKDHATSFESPAFLTLGCAYEKRDRFSGSSYNSMLRRVELFLDQTLPAALRQREQWAVRLLDIDDRVSAHVKALQSGPLDPDEEGCRTAHVGRRSAHAHDEERARFRAEEGAT